MTSLSTICIDLSTYLSIIFSAKLTLVNKHGDTPLDIARNWGDEFIYAMVYAQAASLPPPPEAKGGMFIVVIGATNHVIMCRSKQAIVWL